ncbi:hypothetical protein AN958_02255 [Leucoagaricus sp. SymC.cos]|nr:hypothetical protein AN958_02255 [Leucoagaricus sp. SymC.cos]
MLTGLIALITSQILFLEAPLFAVMCLTWIIQGISSTVVWIVGLAFLCATSSLFLLLRLILGSPIGGTFYSRFGFRGPFVFTIICALIDLLSRLAILEPNESRKWDVDPTTYPRTAWGPVQVMLKLFKSSRALVAPVMAFVNGFVYSSQEPILPLHLQSVSLLRGAISPLIAELAAVSRNIQGIGYSEFSESTDPFPKVGPIVGGQMYDHIQKGWLTTCILGVALLFVAVLLTIPYTGDKPLLTRLRNALMV